ncbi:hypothetical protein D9757_006503 [Collybiopsis confluens]|uniref:Uncharacterized protein n=1 Tax=Collybiopsis confluens TaxID=2823264 RepID=A0A8H5HJJ1_9AGAR|nr:hypothetical protein D9757_006503 [Collybiopsis confluens]
MVTSTHISKHTSSKPHRPRSGKKRPDKRLSLANAPHREKILDSTTTARTELEMQRLVVFLEDPAVTRIEEFRVTCVCGSNLALDTDRTTFSYNNYAHHRKSCKRAQAIDADYVPTETSSMAYGRSKSNDQKSGPSEANDKPEEMEVEPPLSHLSIPAFTQVEAAEALLLLSTGRFLHRTGADVDHAGFNIPPVAPTPLSETRPMKPLLRRRSERLVEIQSSRTLISSKVISSLL